jgi:D-arabinose 5-phosphate isomerase GutQ
MNRSGDTIDDASSVIGKEDVFVAMSVSGLTMVLRFL